MLNGDMVRGRDFIIVGQQPWDTEIGSNCKNIALELSRSNRVLYVNSALDRISLLRGKNDAKVQKRLAVIKGKQDGIELIQENLWTYYPDCLIESINWIKSKAVFNLLNKRNNRLFARSIKQAVSKLGFANTILFNDNDMFRSFYLKEMLKPDLSIYYSRDFMLAVDYWKYHGTDLEPALIAKSDICMANSTYLANYCRQYNPCSYYVGQGCDLDMFSGYTGTEAPGDMVNIPRPVIGYVGALQSIRLDIELLGYIATQRPEWSIVLVGPEDNEFKKSSLHAVKNIYFLGGKDPSLLPAYIDVFDVCLNPQIVNQVTIGNYPRKIDEYLAMGKPVVATATEAMSIFSEYTYLAVTRDDYLELIERALKENSSELQSDRRVFASSHTWANNVTEIYRAINDFNTKKQNNGGTH